MDENSTTDDDDDYDDEPSTDVDDDDLVAPDGYGVRRVRRRTAVEHRSDSLRLRVPKQSPKLVTVSSPKQSPK